MGRKEFHLVIVSPERTLYEGEVRAVILPGELGKFEVLKDHAPLISSLAAGEVKFREGRRRTGTEFQTLQIQGGFAEVKDNQVSVCVET